MQFPLEGNKRIRNEKNGEKTGLLCQISHTYCKWGSLSDSLKLEKAPPSKDNSKGSLCHGAGPP